MIWKKTHSVSSLNEFCKSTMVSHLGIEFTEIGPDYLAARMPVDQRTFQPARIMHGGASVSLAETLGSIGSYLCIEDPSLKPVGLEINANHLRPVSSGWVEAKAKPVHLGRTTHVWEIRLEHEGKLTTICRMTNALIKP